MHIKDKEYHEFGPWLLEIKSAEDIPPQYVDYADQILQADYSIKVPVLLVRREIRPGALMYNQVVMLYSDRIEILEFVDGSISKREMPYSSIKYIIHGGELLSSYIHFEGGNTAMRIRYNSVSNDVTMRIMQQTRNAICTDQKKIDTSFLKKHLELEHLKDSQIYKYFCIKEELKSNIHILGYQPFMDLTENLPIRLPRFLEKFYMYKLNDTLFMTNGIELIVANRDRSIQKSADVNYAFAHIFIPISTIQDVEMKDDEKFDTIGVTQMTLADRCNVKFHLERNFDMSFMEKIINQV